LPTASTVRYNLYDMSKNPYEVLGVDPQASDEEIRAAYWELARKNHPDASGCPQTAAAFHRATEAYNQLKDPQQRASLEPLPSATRPSHPSEMSSHGRHHTTIFAEPLIPRHPRHRPAEEQAEPLVGTSRAGRAWRNQEISEEARWLLQMLRQMGF
jgi:curved DNA-binding protein CbpA